MGTKASTGLENNVCLHHEMATCPASLVCSRPSVGTDVTESKPGAFCGACTAIASAIHSMSCFRGLMNLSLSASSHRIVCAGYGRRYIGDAGVRQIVRTYEIRNAGWLSPIPNETPSHMPALAIEAGRYSGRSRRTGRACHSVHSLHALRSGYSRRSALPGSLLRSTTQRCGSIGTEYDKLPTDFICSSHASEQPLLHRHRLRQIPRLVHIRPARQRRVVRQQLQRHDMQDR